MFRFEKTMSNDELKLSGAALAATGNAAIFHVENQNARMERF